MFTPSVTERRRELREGADCRRAQRLCVGVSPPAGVSQSLVCFVALLAAVTLSRLSSSRLAWADELPAQAPPAFAYVPGRGLEIGHTGLTLGGYANAEAEKLEGERAEFEVEELSFFVNWSWRPQWRFFSETELEDLLIVDERGRTESGDDLVRQKRLYLDYTWSEHLNVRVGKFLTPVGIWNVIHAAPLVWTVSRPLATTTRFFDDTTTGVMLYGSSYLRGLRLDYSLYGQPTDQLVAQRDDARSARRGAGARMQLSGGESWTLGASSVAQDNQVLRRWEYVNGADFKWEHDRIELWSELVANTPVHGEEDTDWAFYVQATIPLVSDFYGISRYEHGRTEDVNVGILGLAYRPLPNFVIKTQYLFSDRRTEAAERGFAAAVAFLF